jgi:DNA invertase Pin-like site-specific DNA recombinase
VERPVQYIRQSRESRSSTPERQRATCEGYAAAQGWIIQHSYEDIGWSRSEDNTRPGWQQLLRDAEARKFDIVLVEEQSRAAAVDHYAWSAYMSHLRQAGVRLIEAKSGRLLNPSGTDMAGVLTSTIGSVLNTQELLDKSTRTISGKLARIRATGCWQGGPIQFATSIGCYTPEGRLLWKCEPDRGQYRQEYNDGRVLYRDYFPKDRGGLDVLLIQPSSFPERIAAVQTIFQLYSQGVGYVSIARRLNELGYSLPDGRDFYCTFVRTTIKRGVIYTGRGAWNKGTGAKYSRPDPAAPTGIALCADQAGKWQENDESLWIYSRELFTPIISRELWERCQQLSRENAKACSRRSGAVYSGLLYCGHCSRPMIAWATSRSGLLYCCATYHQHGRNNTTGCGVGQVREAAIDRFVDRWLEDTGKALSFCAVPSPLAALYAEREAVCEAARALRRAVEDYLYEHLPPVCHYRQEGQYRVFDWQGDGHHSWSIRLPGYRGSPARLQEIADWLESCEQAGNTRTLAALRAERARLVSLFTEATNKSIREGVAVKVEALEQEISNEAPPQTDEPCYNRRRP